MKPPGNLIIRGGLVVGGTGGAPYEADIQVQDGRIARIGPVPDDGSEVVDARGCIVTPGFVDVHTHYDGQATWSDSLSPTSWHGVTTAVMGNCGVGFAPCRPHQRGMLVELMEGVEDIPGIVLDQGLPWNWSTFPEYLDALSARRFDVDIATQLPHAALRVWVMGERGARRESASAEDRHEMARLAAEAVRAGAFGFSSSRALAHKSRTGEAVPTLDASEDELMAIALALKAEGKGVLQFVTDISEKQAEGEAEFAMLERLVARSGRPMSINITQRERDPQGWKRLMEMVERANARGLSITGQVMGRAIGLLLGFELTDNPFSHHPSYQGLADLPFGERVERLRQSALRARLLAERPRDAGFAGRCFDFDKLFELGPQPDYEPVPRDSIGARAARAGIEPAAMAYDLMLQGGGTGMLYRPLLNYAEGSLAAVREMLLHRHTVPGIADGGAHYGMVCDAGMTSFALSYWARDRTLGERLPLAWLVRRYTADAAALVGLHDRGRILPGLKADLNVIDPDAVRLQPPEVAYDLPAGGRRVVQRADGYVATVLSGVVTRRHGEATGARPGRLLRA